MLDFYQAAVPDGWQILGVRLKPLSLGHLILLHRYESAFVVGGIPTEADLVLSVLICSRTYEDAIDLVESGQVRKEGKKLDKALKRNQQDGQTKPIVAPVKNIQPETSVSEPISSED